MGRSPSIYSPSQGLDSRIAQADATGLRGLAKAEHAEGFGPAIVFVSCYDPDSQPLSFQTFVVDLKFV